MNTISLLLKFLEKAKDELENSPTTEKAIIVNYITSLIGKVTETQHKQLVKLAKNKQPLQHLLDLYTPHKSDYISQATTIVANSYDVLKPCEEIFLYDINDTYYFYFDGNPAQTKKDHCCGCIIDKEIGKTIYSFSCSYELYQSGYYIDDLAIGIFILNYFLKEI